MTLEEAIFLGSKRFFIAGWPKTGKTTLAHELEARTGIPVRHTDDTVSRGWAAATAVVANWMGRTHPIIIEGVTVARSARKWLRENPDGRPCDVLIVLWPPFLRVDEMKPGQVNMGKGIDKALAAVVPELEARGVAVVRAMGNTALGGGGSSGPEESSE